MNAQGQLCQNTGDAQEGLLDALYENQRGYNLNAQGTDNNQADAVVCTGGQFNKFIEKLVGRHPDAEMVYITKAVATNKLPHVVKNVIQEQNLQQKAQDQGVGEVWPEIRDQVFERMCKAFVVEEGLSKQVVQDIVDYGGPYLSLEQLDLQPSQEPSQAQQLSQQGIFGEQYPAEQNRNGPKTK